MRIIALGSVAGVMAGLLLSACGQAQVASAPARLAPEDSPPPPPITSPLTGVVVPTKVAERPVLVVKVENTAAGRPQVNVDRADLVVQEPVEGSLTRLAAFYQSRLPDTVGPVRSIRSSDIGIVRPVRGTLVSSGGARITLSRTAAAGIPIVDENDAAVSRDPTRPAPYNVMANLATIGRTGPGKPARQDYFAFRDPVPSDPDRVAPSQGSQPDPGESAANGVSPSTAQARSSRRNRTSSATVTFGPATTEDWRQRGGQWHRRTPGAGAYTAQSLVILQVRLGTAGYTDPAGNPVPEVRASGRGRGWLLDGPKRTRIQWSKASAKAPWVLRDNRGDRIELTPGTSWVSLVPADVGSTTFG